MLQAVRGGEVAGGLTMGAVVTMRPDLVNAVLMGVPFVDIVTTMLDASIPLTTIEVRLAFCPIMLHKLAAAAKSVPRGSRVLHRRSGVALPGVPDNCARSTRGCACVLYPSPRSQ